MTPVQARQPARRRRPRSGVVLVVALVVAAIAPMSPAEAAIADEVAAVQREADVLTQQLANLETELATIEDEIAALEDEADVVRAEIALLRIEVREIAVNRYVNAGSEPTIWADDPLETAHRDVLLGAVQADSNRAIDAYREASDRLDRSQESLTDRLARQQDAEAELTARLSDLQDELQRLARLQRQADLEAARQAAEERQRAAAATTTTSRPTSATEDTPASSSPTTQPPTGPAPTTPPPTTPPPTTPPPTTPPPTTPPPTSGFVCPVRPSSFVDSFGAPRSGGRLHMGVDMMAPIGTPAVAPVSGTVEHRGNTIGGLSYHLNGDDGNYYYGTHLSAYGQSGRVGAGTVIGYVGDTGNAAGIPHLHFEIHIGGRGNVVNPYPTVRAAC